MKTIFLAVLLLTPALGAQTGAVPLSRDYSSVLPVNAVAFDFEEQGQAVPHWQVQLGPDGKGKYMELSGNSAEQGPPQAQAISVSRHTMDLLLAGADHINGKKPCESRARNLAQTGKKKLTYVYGAASNTCEFNYSDDETLMHVVAGFQAIADTMQYSPRLAHLHRFDRLGLDVEIENLVAAVKDGRAIEVGNIAPVLQSIVEDERVIDRVRRKAARLLQDASSAVPAQASAR